jgi:hypothetical protein
MAIISAQLDPTGELSERDMLAGQLSTVQRLSRYKGGE